MLVFVVGAAVGFLLARITGVTTMHNRDRLSPELANAFRRVERLLFHIHRQGVRIMAKFDVLEAEIARNAEVDASALALIQGIVAQLEQAAGDPAKIAELTANLKSSSDALAAAVAANTPGEPPVDPGV